MAFADEIAGDRKGGWFDQGNSDFADMPLGDVTVSGVPFRIIDPAKNSGRSAVILYGHPRNYFPESVSGIKAGVKAGRLYFLHTVGWGDRPNTHVLTYRVHYTDGSSVDIPVKYAQHINSWGEILSLPGAKIGIERATPVRKHLQVFAWENPHPERTIRSLDILSQKTGSVPAIVAITAETR